MTPEEREIYLNGLTPEARRFLKGDWRLWAREEQLAPEGDWRAWLFLGGRGAGKTRAGAEWVRESVRMCRAQSIALVGATYQDVRDVMIEGPSGLARIGRADRVFFEPSKRRVSWPGGAVAHVFSAEEPHSLRGYQFDAAWCDELGCPAVNKGANRPNVFVDPKSSETALPYFSNGERDDLIQRRFLEAHLNYWADGANNPGSGEYAGPMVDVDNIYVWTWDARPFPFFPSRADVWGDSANYRLGHWMNGRLGSVILADLVPAVCARAGFADADASNISGLVTGFVIDSTMSARDALAPLALAYHFDGVESEGVIRFMARGRPIVATLGEDDLALPEESTLGVNFNRAQETDLSAASRIAYADAAADYRQAVAEARRLVGASGRVAESSLPIVLDQGQAIGIGERLLQDAWVMRETASFTLPPSRIALDPADDIVLGVGDRDHRLRIGEINDAVGREVSAAATDPSIYEPLVGPDRGVLATGGTAQTGRALLAFMDMPLLTGAEIPWSPHVAALASPWPGSVLVYRSPIDSGFTLDRAVAKAATMGELVFDLYAGPTGRWDKGNELFVSLYNGAFASVSDIQLLGGANALAIENEDGEWEVLQFRDAELIAPGQWKLTALLRGQAGTEGAMRSPVAAGARVVVLDDALVQLSLSLDSRNLEFFYRWGPIGKAISDPAYQGTTRAFAGIGLRPLSPTGIRARWPTVAGDIELSWKRRTRIGGDAWDGSDVPLSEESEAYEVDIFDGADVVRTLTSPTPTVTYTLADQTTDFGAQQWSVTARVHQLSSIFGRGQGRSATLFY
jgi:hypothetical protein